jgi:hypothetical protein
MAISLLFGVLVSTVLTLIVIPLGTLSAGEASCRNIAISMGLLDAFLMHKNLSLHQKMEHLWRILAP